MVQVVRLVIAGMVQVVSGHSGNGSGGGVVIAGMVQVVSGHSGNGSGGDWS